MFSYRTETPVQLTPHKCPKCDGVGFLQYNPAIGPFAAATSACGPWQCNVCENGVIFSRVAMTQAAPAAKEGER